MKLTARLGRPVLFWAVFAVSIGIACDVSVDTIDLNLGALGGDSNQLDTAGSSGGDSGSSINNYPEVQFSVDITSPSVDLTTGVAPLTILATASTLGGEPLPEGSYNWTFGNDSDSGSKETHAVRSHVFPNPGTYAIALSLSLAGLSGPISCVSSDTGSKAATVTADDCPDDPNKLAPGVCGCGTPDTDSDGDGTPDCNDGCPNDANKVAPGACGCGTADTDSDGDGILDCNDGCPNDPNKTAPGVCGCGTPEGCEVQPALAGHWTLDGNALDQTPNGNDGTREGDTSFVAGPSGASASALLFDGSSGSVNLGSADALNPDDDFTVMAWIRMDPGASADRSIFSKQVGTSSGWNFNIDGDTQAGGIELNVSDGSSMKITGQADLRDGVWHHVAIVKVGTDRTSWKLYQDGVESPFTEGNNDGVGGAISNSATAYIGQRAWAGSPIHFDGSIDGVRFYTRALSAGEILPIMTGILDTTPPTVVLTAPSDGATVSETITVSADASDDVEMTSVEFFVDGASIATDTSFPFSISWYTRTVTNGPHDLSAVATDWAGNRSPGSELIPVTVDNPPDVTPPVISGVQATSISSGGATIVWTTDEPATSQVEYGETTSYGSTTTFDDTLTLLHSVDLTGLQPSTTYHFRVHSQDLAGNPATSDSNFTTTDISTATSITQWGITWTFDGAYPVGQFVNGDYWVVGPVIITSVSPAPAAGLNGSVVNPVGPNQGYDSGAGQYDAAQLATFPLVLSPNQSLVSTISHDTSGFHCDMMNKCRNVSELRSAAVLTSLTSSVSPDTFRPPFPGPDKPLYLTAQLRHDLLPGLAAPSGVDTSALLPIYERYLERVWLDHVTGWTRQYIHPTDNQPGYGREVSQVVSDASMLLMLDDPNNERLLILFVQAGIDLYATAMNGGVWDADGGHSSGRKWPILFAGLMLDDDGMKNIGNYTFPHWSALGFGEDCQTYYDASGNAKFGIRHCYLPDQDDTSKSESYRICCTSHAWVGFVLSARLLWAQELWNHDALFDYVDSWMAVERNGGSNLVESMWDAYR